MLGIFKKKRNITEEDYFFLKKLSEKLSEKYPYLLEQITEDFILDKKDNKLGGKGTYTLVLNAKLEHEYSSKLLPKYFILKDIKVWNTKTNSYELVELDIMEGILAGYKLKSHCSDLDLDNIDLNSLKEKKFKNEEQEELKEIIGEVDDEVRKYLDIESTFKIEIPEGNFYVIKDFKDGNYICIDKNGEVYSLVHDPYEVKRIFVNKDDFFKQIERGGFI